jgi:hypothetical protein
VLVATGHIIYREQEITSRPEKLAIRRRRSTDQLGLFYYEVEHAIEKANTRTDQGSGVPDKEIEVADERV